jgi:hypothetical protein
MPSALADNAQATRLRPGIRPALAASAEDELFSVQLELISILDGPAFRGSLKSQAFLRFVVEEALGGRFLKERTIGAAVLGKAPDYDTGDDPGVRVRANDVRKRLAAHYDSSTSVAGIRIEMPPGGYTPKFIPVRETRSPATQYVPEPKPLALWQLAAPTLIAIFLALAAIRGGVESNDAFSRFWNRALANCNQIAIVFDDAGGRSMPDGVLEAALPLERLADVFQLPVHVIAANRPEPPRALIIRLSTSPQPFAPHASRIAGATFSSNPSQHRISISAATPEALQAALQIVTSRSGFPDPDQRNPDDRRTAITSRTRASHSRGTNQRLRFTGTPIVKPFRDRPQ